MITITDCTLRDGNHAVRHQLSKEQIHRYAAQADAAGIDIIEVGHGNGLGGSSALLGISCVDDREMLEIARSAIQNGRLGIHFIPGLGKSTDLEMAIDVGVDVFRIASHCTEANITAPYIESVKNQGKTVYGVLMMTHMAEPELLAEQASLMAGYGADAVILMDSAGHLTPDDVRWRIQAIQRLTDTKLGFHAHNNLGMAVANSIAAVEEGAELLDACIKGFGAGAGNTQLETLIAVLNRLGYRTQCSFEAVAGLARTSEQYLDCLTPHIGAANIASGIYGLFSGFAPHIRRAAEQFSVDEFRLYQLLGQRKLVAGQEDIIIETAAKLSTAN
ncbi:4-hydroxy-2-oxovalerate aldolase [Pseudomonas sp. M20]|jgi:4-hydroxy 2-oxovalerate aldolase|uniref:4-hydroxy-2-oxovalerate aldolase n=1 Tax=unclassified Pseudomonas TaxID=196821 RepID=UPI0013200838|nr:4-hydroxy-2-oxovalerate aldolase [Pseudomonas sp. R84]QHC93080.1 4-hydroxy-2-oxovalerate aldolase [Pseudomonas sp. R84]